MDTYRAKFIITDRHWHSCRVEMRMEDLIDESEGLFVFPRVTGEAMRGFLVDIKVTE